MMIGIKLNVIAKPFEAGSFCCFRSLAYTTRGSSFHWNWTISCSILWPKALSIWRPSAIFNFKHFHTFNRM